MSTKQNYFVGDNYANAPQSLTWNKAAICQQLDLLHQTGSLTDEQREWATIIRVMDNGMSPQLVDGSSVVAVELTDDEFKKYVSKVVAIKLNTDPKRYLIGRLIRHNGKSIILNRDNKNLPELTVSWKAIYQVYILVWLLNTPVL